jgi:hypothetical protein
MVVVIQVAAVGLGGWLQLLRIPGPRPWTTLYWDDYGTFLVQALQHPWHLLTPDRGYVQVLPHLIAQLAAYLPLSWAAWVLSGGGALLAAACALVVYHASAGHIQSRALRALLGLTIVLSPVTPLEIIDSTLGVPWYLLLALFWMVLWRPRTGAGMAVAAGVALATAASTSIAVLFAAPLALRLYVLRHPREHAVTAGWLAGCLVQLPFVITGYTSHASPLNTAHESSLGNSLAFYARDVVLPSLGWHMSWWLQRLAGRDGATVIVAVILAVFFLAITVAVPRSRLLVAVTLLFGFLFAVTAATLQGYLSGAGNVTPVVEGGARYTVLPIFLIEAAIIIAADCAINKPSAISKPSVISKQGAVGWRTVAAAAVVVAVFAVSWIPDFRYQDFNRIGYSTPPWGLVVAKWRHDCTLSPTGIIIEKAMDGMPALQPLPCSHLHF